mmetsp:Transcript_46025/g.107966  ORF Transcript_46025/g.107966 Transcript_46025/m.107966 type:complete len:231 (-) Transcript_46025:35-727(-)
MRSLRSIFSSSSSLFTFSCTTVQRSSTYCTCTAWSTTSVSTTSPLAAWRATVREEWRMTTVREEEVRLVSSMRIVLLRSPHTHLPKSSIDGCRRKFSRLRTSAFTVINTGFSGSCWLTIWRVSQNLPLILGVKMKSRSCCPCGLTTPMLSSSRKFMNSSETQLRGFTIWYISGTSERFLMISFFVQSSLARTVPKLMLRWATSIILLHTLALIGRYRTGIWLIPGDSSEA